MAKKRKLEVKQEKATSQEIGSVVAESVKEASATIPSESLIEGTSAPKSRPPAKEEPLPEVEFKAVSIETSDLVPDPSVSSDPLTTDVASHNDDDDEEEDENDTAFLDKLLEPFSKEQLISLIRDATSKHPDLWDSIRQTADVDPAHRKVFVHGLGWSTTAETLGNVFRQYGEIEECNAVVDKISGKSKGYGFILFKHRRSAWRALKEPQKKIGNRMAACQLASIGPVPPSAPAPSTGPVLPASEYTQRKIYVSNVGADLDPQKVTQFFARFGEIEEGPLGLDKATGKPKGFCLFVYKSVDSAKKALEEPHKNFEGHILHCQRAIDGPKSNKPGAYIPHAGGQYTGHHQASSGFGVRGAQMGGMTSPMGGPGHLIAPPASSFGINQAGLTINNGIALKPAFGNQVGGAGGFIKPGVIGGYGASQMHGNYGGTAIGQGSARTQQGFGNMGIGPYIG